MNCTQAACGGRPEEGGMFPLFCPPVKRRAAAFCANWRCVREDWLPPKQSAFRSLLTVTKSQVKISAFKACFKNRQTVRTNTGASLASAPSSEWMNKWSKICRSSMNKTEHYLCKHPCRKVMRENSAWIIKITGPSILRHNVRSIKNHE